MFGINKALKKGKERGEERKTEVAKEWGPRRPPAYLRAPRPRPTGPSA